MANSTETGGSATELSATDAWHGAAVGDEAYVSLIRTVARDRRLGIRAIGNAIGIERTAR